MSNQGLENLVSTLEPDTAYFLHYMATHPGKLEADKIRGGLSEIGVRHHSPILRRHLQPAFKELAESEQLKSLANKSRIPKEMNKGTVAVSLNDQQLERLFEIFNLANCPLDNFQQNIFPASITI